MIDRTISYCYMHNTLVLRRASAHPLSQWYWKNTENAQGVLTFHYFVVCDPLYYHSGTENAHLRDATGKNRATNVNLLW